MVCAKINVFCFVIFCVLLFSVEVRGHGRLIEPPSRSSMWRYGFNTPPNYNDMELFCGGTSVQWSQNGGRCGVCGDAFHLPQPRPNEAGGKYGKGIIVRRYRPGQVIRVTVQLTANHLGFFEFKICPNNNPGRAVTQRCLDAHPLHINEANGHQYYLPRGQTGNMNLHLRLPQNLRCSQCVLQWHYRGGNNWGTCPDGSGKLGCGPQETFRACADVAIQ